MPRESCIKHSGWVWIFREDYYLMLDRDDCATVVLGLLEHATNKEIERLVKAKDPSDPWVEASISHLAEESCNHYSDKSIRNALTKLESVGAITSHQTSIGSVKGYLLDQTAIQKALDSHQKLIGKITDDLGSHTGSHIGKNIGKITEVSETSKEVNLKTMEEVHGELIPERENSEPVSEKQALKTAHNFWSSNRGGKFSKNADARAGFARLFDTHGQDGALALIAEFLRLHPGSDSGHFLHWAYKLPGYPAALAPPVDLPPIVLEPIQPKAEPEVGEPRKDYSQYPSRWSEVVVPFEWGPNSPTKLLNECCKNPAFQAAFEEVCTKTRKLHDAGTGEWITFPWILKFDKESEVWNWQKVINGTYSAKSSKPKQSTHDEVLQGALKLAYGKHT